MSWDNGQARSFAKRIAERYGAAWFVLTMDIREAVVSEFVLSIVLAQVKTDVKVEDISALRNAICQQLLKRYRMKTETASQCQTDAEETT